MPNMQIFIYNATDYGIDNRNNFPLLTFQTTQDLENFIRGLRSVPREAVTGNTVPYFVINNPQLLPGAVRYLHTYPYQSPYIEDYVSNELLFRRAEGAFRMCDNIEYIQRYYNCIDNNTTAPTGFTRFLTLYSNRIF